jgi:hypothetical protein
VSGVSRVSRIRRGVGLVGAPGINDGTVCSALNHRVLCKYMNDKGFNTSSSTKNEHECIWQQARSTATRTLQASTASL